MRTFTFAASLLSAVSLATAFGPRSQCTTQYTPTSTDTCDSISESFAVPVTQIEALNKGISCSAPINFHDVCLKTFTPACTLNATAAATTCDDLVEKYELDVDVFVSYNDNVNEECDNLVQEDPYCVSTAACYPGDTNPVCKEFGGR